MRMEVIWTKTSIIFFSSCDNWYSVCNTFFTRWKTQVRDTDWHLNGLTYAASDAVAIVELIITVLYNQK